MNYMPLLASRGIIMELLKKEEESKMKNKKSA